MIKQARICDKCGSLIEIIEPWNEPWMGEDVCKDCRRSEPFEGWRVGLEESDTRKKKDKFMIEKYD